MPPDLGGEAAAVRGAAGGETIQSPSELFGELFTQVQGGGLFPDSKTFVDLDPAFPPAQILTDFRQLKPQGTEALSRFVAEHFRAPQARPNDRPAAETDLRSHIRALWPRLLRRPEPPAPGSSRLAVSQTYIAPGGRFNEAYYWDTYFSLLGLVADGLHEEARNVVLGVADLIERFGYVPNGTRTYYLGRSQPPLFFLMIEAAGPWGAAETERLLAALRIEHMFWMRGADDVAPGQALRRVVRTRDGRLLNRYWDAAARPRDEAYWEDVELAGRSPRPAAELYRDLRAGAESGWDFSSRWCSDPDDLATIRTTAFAPIDLNAFLWGMERRIADLLFAQGDDAAAAPYDRAADRRGSAIAELMWDPSQRIFCDYDWPNERMTGVLTGAALAPLFVGVANPEQASGIVDAAAGRLLRAGGLVCTETRSRQQWDAPNGWAPLHWMAVEGLRRYGRTALADDIRDRWLQTISDVFHRTGRLVEKYDVENAGAGDGGEYRPQYGFGWTNGVTQALLSSALWPLTG